MKKKRIGTSIWSERGITLLEVLISVCILGATVLAFIQWDYIYQQSASLVHKDEVIDNAIGKVVDAFGTSSSYCNYILSTFPGNPNPNPNLQLNMSQPNGAQVQSVDFHDSNGLILSNVLTLSKAVDARQDLVMTDIRLKPVAALSATNIIAKLEFKFTRSGSPGAPEILRRISINATIDPSTNYVISCTAAPDSVLSIEDTICNINSDGYAHYDATTQACADNPNVHWFTSTSPTQASCPSGYSIAASKLDASAADLACFSSGAGINLPPRTYQNGVVSSGPTVTAWTASIDSNFVNCKFAYVTSVDPATYVAEVKCAN